MIFLVKINNFLRDGEGRPKLNNSFASKFVGIVVIESSWNKGNWFPIFLHLPQSHDTNSPLQRHQLSLIMAAALWEYPHTFALRQSLPHFLVQIVKLEFGRYLVLLLGAIQFELFLLFDCNKFGIADHLLYFDCLFGDLQGFVCKLREFCSFAFYSVALDAHDYTRPFLGHILSPFDRDRSGCLDELAQKWSSHGYSGSNEVDVPLNNRVEKLSDLSVTIPSTNWLLWFPKTMVGPSEGILFLLMTTTSLKNIWVQKLHKNLR